jgi:cysteinyl-tRNA synthetase
VSYARYWTHNGLLTMQSGQKMGKSLGNVINVEDALASFPAQALRLYYLQSHYRSPLPWGAEALPDALAMVSRLYEAREVAESMEGDEPAAAVVKDLGEDAVAAYELGVGFRAKFDEALDEDFNTAQALGHLFELARAVNRLGNHKKAKKRARAVVQPALDAFALVARATGIMGQPTGEFLDEVRNKRLAAMGLLRGDIERLISERDALRRDKRWAEADQLRAELDQKGIVVMDGPAGAEWRVRV